jgi:hypothetical protein
MIVAFHGHFLSSELRTPVDWDSGAVDPAGTVGSKERDNICGGCAHDEDFRFVVWHRGLSHWATVAPVGRDSSGTVSSVERRRR